MMVVAVVVVGGGGGRIDVTTTIADFRVVCHQEDHSMRTRSRTERTFHTSACAVPCIVLLR